MPRVLRDLEMMDVYEPVVPEPAVPETPAPEPTEPPVEPEEEECKETINLRAADFYALQDTLEDIQF
jgi:hypothetical protein